MNSGFSYDDVTTLSDFMHEIVMGDERKQGFKIKNFAEHVGKGQSTVYGELNKFDQNYKLGANTVLQYMKFADDVRPLEWLAAKMGYSLTKIDAEPDRDTWQAEHVQDMSDIGEMARMMDEGAEPYTIFQQAEKAKHNIDETVNRYFMDFRDKGNGNK